MSKNYKHQSHRMLLARRFLSLVVMLFSTFIALRAAPVYALDTCYAVADTGNGLVSLNKTSGKVSYIGQTGRNEIESIVFKPNSEQLYTADGNELGTLSLVTGTFSSIGMIGAGEGSQGTVTFGDIDGLAWESTTNRIYAVQRFTGPDLLFQIDPTTGAHVSSAFGDADYIQIGVTSHNESNVDDLAFDPSDGTLFGVANSGGTGGTLIKIDKLTGNITEVGSLIEAGTLNVIDDMEGLSFFNNGELYGSTGDSGPDLQDHNKLFRINKENGEATFVADFVNDTGNESNQLVAHQLTQFMSDTALNRLSDFEALACLTQTIADDDQDGIVNSGEDLNNNGSLEDDDSDGDGIPDYRDDDDDNDTILTIDEDPNKDNNPVNDDTDGDGTPNYLDIDDDGDGILSKDEDKNQDQNPKNDDSDDDSLPDYLEPNNVDTDKDDLFNHLDNDDDGDTIFTEIEGAIDEDDDGKPNYLDLNSDGDTRSDSAEWSASANDLLAECTTNNPICTNNDADGDSIPNYLDRDSDNDLLLDSQEQPGDINGDGIPNWLDPQTGLPKLYLPIISKN